MRSLPSPDAVFHILTELSHAAVCKSNPPPSPLLGTRHPRRPPARFRKQAHTTPLRERLPSSRNNIGVIMQENKVAAHIRCGGRYFAVVGVSERWWKPSTTGLSAAALFCPDGVGVIIHTCEGHGMGLSRCSLSSTWPSCPCDGFGVDFRGQEDEITVNFSCTMAHGASTVLVRSKVTKAQNVSLDQSLHKFRLRRHLSILGGRFHSRTAPSRVQGGQERG
ncbi:uncharacterized protein IWZ02DRAFT_157179 [Phyllosticta citriasiana]|uniref:uncharacterized protein n=1 Tax=Phyllosticta citriasiana TaxID=595635 RepID=UPI0030FDD0F2